MFPTVLENLVTALREKGGKPYLVGGAVRDMALGNKPKDFDVEIFGLPAEDIISVASRFGRVDKVGASFGVIILKTLRNTSDGNPPYMFDLSIPRIESKSGQGYKGFIAHPDPSMSPQDAAARRDFTFNALMYDFEKQQILDFFDGIYDLKHYTLRHTSPAFVEDPLRVLRGFQFAGRFQMTVARETAILCQTLLSEYNTLAAERIWGEWLKWATKSHTPSFGLRFLVDTGWIDAYPQIKALIGLPQSEVWHPEGDVFAHTCHVVDEANIIARQKNLWGEHIENQKKKPSDQQGFDRAMLILAALCHDFGKVDTTVWANTNKTKPWPQWIFQKLGIVSSSMRYLTSLLPSKELWTWRSPGHCQTGVDKADTFLQSIGTPIALIERIKPLIDAHLEFLNITSKRTVRRLATKLHPATIEELCWLIEADHNGRPPLSRGLPEEAQRMQQLAVELKVEQEKPRPLLLGRILIAENLMKPGPEMGKFLEIAFQAQLDGEFTTPEDAVKWAQARLS